jgi:hypothetical protein
MIVPTDIAFYAGSGFISAGVAYGILKVKVSQAITYQQHAKLCAAEREDTRKQLEDFRSTLHETAQKVSEIHGYLAGLKSWSL